MANNEPELPAEEGAESASISPQASGLGWQRKPPSAPFPRSLGTAKKPAGEDLADYLAELDQWAEENRRDARRDTWAFWALKAPAIVSSASAAVWAHFAWTTAAMISAAVASVCVAIDGIYPRGGLRNAHLRAVHDIRTLASDLTSQFRSSVDQSDDAVRKIIRESQGERLRIAGYIRDAETNLKVVGTDGTKHTRRR